jgi:PAS domain S-box-containing protein
VTNWNAGAQRIKGYTRSEIVGEHFSRFYTEEARQAGLPELALATAARTGRFEAEDWRVRKDGSRFWANVILDAIHDEDGQLVGFAKITRDLTERHAVEEKLRQVQRMEAIGQLTAGITHDFNNLLTVILGNLELLERLQSQDDNAIGSDRAARCISTAVEGGRRAAALTRRLLAFSRQQALEPEAVDVRRLIHRVRELLERTLGEAIKIQVNLAPGLGFVFADISELENAIINLAVNARDAMPNGGSIVIEAVKVDAVPANGDRDHAEGPHILIDIADTGVGMTQEVMSRAFEPFFTTKGSGRGTGLGLSQVYGFVKQSGGHIAVDSQPGLGTSVKIYLPRHFPEAGAEAAANLRKPASAKEMGSDTILVVEDDDAVRAFGTEVLRCLGYTVLEAANAGDALKILESRFDVRLLFTDMGLPGQMNGWQLSQEVSRRWPAIKLIATTAYLRDAPRGGLGRGIAVLAKPFSFNDLAKKVQEVLRT